MKRLLFSVLGGVLILFLLLLIGLTFTWTGHPDAAESFIKYTLRWAFTPLGLFLDIRPGSGQRWAAIFLSWFLNVAVFSFLLYLLQWWWARRKSPA
jgi:predicted permease